MARIKIVLWDEAGSHPLAEEPMSRPSALPLSARIHAAYIGSRITVGSTGLKYKAKGLISGFPSWRPYQGRFGHC
jgi:hypothetical protein